ncbi:NYN domain-containing protein [Anaerolentibacter hominis]|uniref:NYN domain-containing protein n=1 Tax=Anaerolentibacter hominis TaxID=3079009 RepID=UPI0031B84731
MAGKNYLLVDGYNIIFAWEDLRELAQENLEAARGKLADALCNYQGFIQDEVILVFDGHKVPGNPGSVYRYHNIHIIYTKEAETADQYIEMASRRIEGKYNVRVATSDGLEQVIILGAGATRVSARELKKELEESEKIIREKYLAKTTGKRNSLLDNLSPEMARWMEELRLKETKH